MLRGKIKEGKVLEIILSKMARETQTITMVFEERAKQQCEAEPPRSPGKDLGEPE